MPKARVKMLIWAWLTSCECIVMLGHTALWKAKPLLGLHKNQHCSSPSEPMMTGKRVVQQQTLV